MSNRDAEGIERLRDGSLVRVRPLGPDDKARVLEGFRALSNESRYRRFFGAVATLSEATLRYLTEIDQANHLAWIAVDPAREGEPALGVARCVRIVTEPNVAEVAVAVADTHQNRGLGSLLLERLAEAALGKGMTTFRAVVLWENDQVVHALQDIGIHGKTEGNLLHIDIAAEEVRRRAHAWRTRTD